jgi:hypothetical protein
LGATFTFSSLSTGTNRCTGATSRTSANVSTSSMLTDWRRPFSRLAMIERSS